MLTPDHFNRRGRGHLHAGSDRESGRLIALFRCTQMVLYPKPPA